MHGVRTGTAPRRRGDLWARLLASPWALLAPAAVALTAVAAYPLLYGIRASFHTYRYGRDLGSAGLENYRVIFHDHDSRDDRQGEELQ